MTIHTRDEGPVLHVTMEGRLNEPEFRAYHATLLERMQLARARGQRFVVIGDARRSPPLDGAARRRIAAFMAEHDELARATIAGSYWVVTNPLQRGVLAAIAWLRAPPIPIRAFDTVAEAEAAARRALAFRGPLDGPIDPESTDVDPPTRES